MLESISEDVVIGTAEVVVLRSRRVPEEWRFMIRSGLGRWREFGVRIVSWYASMAIRRGIGEEHEVKGGGGSLETKRKLRLAPEMEMGALKIMEVELMASERLPSYERGETRGRIC